MENKTKKMKQYIISGVDYSTRESWTYMILGNNPIDAIINELNKENDDTLLSDIFICDINASYALYNYNLFQYNHDINNDNLYDICGKMSKKEFPVDLLASCVLFDIVNRESDFHIKMYEVKEKTLLEIEGELDGYASN